MRRNIAGLAVGISLLAAACSSSQPITALGTTDASTKRACAAFRDLQRRRAAGTLADLALRAKLAEVYQAASNSDMPLIRARAVALYADATVLATGGQPGSLTQDLAAMADTCSSI
jgi:hypothetical protein